MPRLYILHLAILPAQSPLHLIPKVMPRSPQSFTAVAKDLGFFHLAQNFNQQWGTKTQGWCDQLPNSVSLTRQLGGGGSLFLEWSELFLERPKSDDWVFTLKDCFLVPRVKNHRAKVQGLSTFIIGQGDNQWHFHFVWYEKGFQSPHRDREGEASLARK